QILNMQPSAPAPAKTNPMPVTITMNPPAAVPAPLPVKAPVPAPALPAPAPAPVVTPVSKTEAAPVRRQGTPSPEAQQAIAVLSGNTTSQERQQAADGLKRADMYNAPELVRHLITTAQSEKEDADTRVACIRALVRNQVHSPAVMAALEGMSHDEAAPVRV